MCDGARELLRVDTAGQVRWGRVDAAGVRDVAVRPVGEPVRAAALTISSGRLVAAGSGFRVLTTRDGAVRVLLDLEEPRMTASTMRTVTLPDGTAAPALGMGTWYLGEDPGRNDIQLDALRTGIDIGLTLVDTAEMYGDGAAEELVGRAIAGRRDDVFLVSKVLPHHATRQGTVDACQRSLRRLGTDRLDLYLLHWRGRVPVEETVAAFESLVSRGLIRSWGVSNFDVPDLDQLVGLPGDDRVQTDQVLYNLARRGPEYDLIPWCRGRRMPLMAYSPVDHGRLLEHRAVRDLAAEKGVTPAQLAIAWVLRLPDVFAVAKASTRAHVIDDRAALEIGLSQAELDQLDRLFPPPSGKVPLDVL